MPPPELLAELELGPMLSPLRATSNSQSLMPIESQQAPSTPAPVDGLIIPVSSSVGPGGFALLGNGPSSIGGHVAADHEMIDFTFDENGEFVDLAEEYVNVGTPARLGGSTMHSDAGASAKVRQDHEDGLRAGAQQVDNQMDIDLPMFGDDLPEGEAFSTGNGSHQDQHSKDVVELSDTVQAPIRRTKRAARVLPTDTTLELRNKDLSDWNANYLANMKEASKQKIQLRLSRLAKKNAEFWMWGSGIGGIAARMQGVSGPTPFDRFIGDNLFEFFTGVSRKSGARSKRDRDSGIDEVTQEESRRVRQKTDGLENEIERGQEDEGLFIPGGDDVELPREEQVPLDDQQRLSEMPWNITASVRGSSAVPRSGRVGLTGSAPPSSLMGRNARMVSESPLHGRSRPDGLDDLQFLADNEGGFGNLGGDDYVGFAGSGISSDLPEAMLAETNARVREALTAEGGNFLTFVVDAIDEKRNRIHRGLEPKSDDAVDAIDAVDEVSFAEVIPPHANSKTVASSALMMTLTLGTKGLLNVRQVKHFTDINMSLTEKGKVAQLDMPIRKEYGRHVGEEEAEHDEAGHFDEQFVPVSEESNDEDEEDEGSVFGK
ncbi:R8 protein [Didymosphaeria variabile]|uniref:R8 protein n=1 Tax=Didymosphaeria variabile TaxID=1932322 RepID=A0A9W8XPW1_9PLEO|nr:R8 protein [Didymosphaeria variabile]KAJ4356042.1 R8 protein [Didymosphaeria variabile]